MKKSVYDMGAKTSKAFKGNSECRAINELYGQSATLFADIIKSELGNTEINNHKYTLLDIGSSEGELLEDVLKLLPEYTFDVTVTDTNKDSISRNRCGKGIVADAESLPFEDRSMDVTLMRYALHFNSLEAQQRIIAEIARVTRGFAIIESGGPDDINPDNWRSVVDGLFNNDTLPQLKRSGMFYTSASEVEGCMNKSNITYRKVRSNKINGLSEIFTERYDFSDKQKELVKKMLDDKNYITQTTWVIYPKTETIPEFGIKRDNEERRDGGCAVIFDPKTGLYAVGKQTDDGLFRLFSGGVDPKEDIEKGVLREAVEESGLHDFLRVEYVAEAFTHYHNSLRNVNRVAKATCFLIILKSADLIDTKLEAHEKFTLAWATADEILANWQSRNASKDFDHWIYFFKKAVSQKDLL